MDDAQSQLPVDPFEGIKLRLADNPKGMKEFENLVNSGLPEPSEIIETINSLFPPRDFVYSPSGEIK
jgi:hypothetical protein